MTDIAPPAEVDALQALDAVARDDFANDLSDWAASGPGPDPTPLIDAIANAIGPAPDDNMRLALRMEMLAARDGGSTDGDDLAVRIAWLAIAVSG